MNTSAVLRVFTRDSYYFLSLKLVVVYPIVIMTITYRYLSTWTLLFYWHCLQLGVKIFPRSIQYRRLFIRRAVMWSVNILKHFNTQPTVSSLNVSGQATEIACMHITDDAAPESSVEMVKKTGEYCVLYVCRVSFSE